jgi:hypothetical protein
MGWLSIQKMMRATAVLAALLSLSLSEAIAKGEKPAERQGRDEKRADSQVTYGRAVIFRAGHLPQLAPGKLPSDKTRPAQRVRPTHFLNTTLPVIIQGAPNELALRRHINTG